MRIVLPLLALAFATAATPPPQPIPQAFDRGPLLAVEDVTSPPSAARSPMPEIRAAPGSGERVCRDRIHEVREERGLPKLDRENASPDEPLMILAVDKRIDGCSVMVMAYDTNDIRPVPTVPAGPPRVQRIPGQ